MYLLVAVNKCLRTLTINAISALAFNEFPNNSLRLVTNFIRLIFRTECL